MPYKNIFTLVILFITLSNSIAQVDYKKNAADEYFYTSRKINIDQRLGEVDLNRINTQIFEMVKRENIPVRAYKSDSLTSFFDKKELSEILLQEEYVEIFDEWGEYYDSIIYYELDPEEVRSHIATFKVLPGKDFSKYTFELTGIGLTREIYDMEVVRILFFLDIQTLQNELEEKDFNALIEAYNKSLFEDYTLEKTKGVFENNIIIQSNHAYDEENINSETFNSIISVPLLENAKNGHIKVFDEITLEKPVQKDSVENIGKNTVHLILFDEDFFEYDTVIYEPFYPNTNVFSGIFRTKQKGSFKTIVEPVGFGFINKKYDYSGELLYLEKMYWAKLSDLEKLFSKTKFDYLKRQIFFGLVFKEMEF
jgi:hypothetical protein